MRRVVVTGLGIVSSIGNDRTEVAAALREGTSGIELIPEMRDLGFKCHVAGRVKDLDLDRVPKRTRLTMSSVARYAAVAALDALEEAGLAPEDLQHERAGVIVSTGLGGPPEWTRAETLLRKHRNPSRVGATGLVKAMQSTVAGNLAAWLGVKGRAYAVCSSFCSGIDSIGHAYELIARGVLDVCLCGAAEENALRQFWGFIDNWRGLPTSWNDSPERACRPYDRDREGTVFSEGAGVLLLEAEEHAARRNVEPYAAVVGYGAANDGCDMFRPSGDGLRESIRQALESAGAAGVQRIDYVNSHGSGTRVHDALEVELLKETFGTSSPMLSSTKAQAGHALSATGAQEAVFTLLMLRHGFVAPTLNLEHVAPDCEGVDHVRSRRDVAFDTAVCFNAGLGGSNACLAFARA